MMMIKKLTIIILVLTSLCLNAQNEYDALIFSQYLPHGTARYTAMGGAFSALGADMSVMATNPAGMGLYRKGELAISTAWTNRSVESNFMGSKNESDNFSYQLANFGFVNVNENYNDDWKRVNIAFGYNHLNDYNRTFEISGINNVSSLLDAQVDIINNYPDDADLNAYYDAELIFIDEDGQPYTNDYELFGSYSNIDQQHKVKTAGYAGEYNLNVSSNYKDFVFIGATIGFQRLNYSSYIQHSEISNNNEIALNDFESIDNLSAKGSGFNLKIGALVKLNQMFRVAAAFHSPTVYNVKYDYWTDVYAHLDFGDGEFSSEGYSPKDWYNWQFKTPSKFILSGAAVIGKMGLLSAEVEYMDYASINMSSDDDFFDAENAKISRIYSSVVNARLGGEVKLSIFSLRAGVCYMDSPYSSSAENSDSYKLALSGGAGINMGAFYFDIAIQNVSGSEYYYMYGYDSSEAMLKNSSNKFMATLGCRF